MRLGFGYIAPMLRNLHLPFFALVALSASAIGCGAYTYQGYALYQADASSPKPPGCNFRVGSTMPGEGYKEVGTLTLKNGINGNVPRDSDTFSRDIGSQVCQVGGDLVVAELNGRGDIVRGVVFRRSSVAAR